MEKIQFEEQGIAFDRNGTVVVWNWADVQGLYFPVFGRTPYILGKNHRRLVLDGVKNADLGHTILNFYSRWKEKFPYLAKKNAFDYAEPQASGAILLLSISVLFCGLISLALLNETWVEYQCTKSLSANAVVQTAEIVSMRKGQQGNFTLNLRFQTAAGEVFTGQRLTMKTFNYGDADPKQASVIYPPDRPGCWQLSETFGQNDINWAKRRYTVAFNLIVGIVFGLIGAFGSLVSVIRLRQTRPFAADVAASFRLKMDN